MPPRKPTRRGPAKQASPHVEERRTPAGALATDDGGRPLIDPQTGLPIVAGQEAPDGNA